MATTIPSAMPTTAVTVSTTAISTTVAAKTDTKTAKKPRGTTKKRKKNPLVFPPYPLLRKNNNNDNENAKNDDENDFLESVANLLMGKKNIVVLVGAGISTSVGIPDFRSKDKGLYNTLDAGALGLSCPEDLFCIEFFKSNPLPFYKFAKHLYYPNQKEKATATATATATARGKHNTKSKNKHDSSSNKKKSKETKEQKPLPATRTSTRTSQRIRKSRRTRNGEEQEPSKVVNGERETATLPKPDPPATSSSGAVAVTHQAGTASPSDSHKLLALLEKKKMLLRVYTQNIDGLESSAGVSDAKIVYCHGSLRSMSCTKCSKKNLPLDKSILESIEAGSVPFCKVAVKTKTSSKLSKSPSAAAGSDPVLSQTRTSKRTKRTRSAMEGDNEHEHSGERYTNGHNNNNNNYNYNCYNYTTPDGTIVPCCGGVLKPGITFFGETLDNSVGRKIESDQSKADALIVIGTSLSVAPISRVIEYLPKNIPRILINQTIVHPKSTTTNTTTTSTATAVASINDDNCDENDGDFRKNYVFDAYLLGFCDDVTRALGKQLGLGCNVEKKAKPTKAGEIKTKTKQSKKPPPKMAAAAAAAAAVVARHASDTGAKLLKGENLNSYPDDDGNEMEDPGWRGITVPRERVLLFPGALPTVVSGNTIEKGKEATPTASYQTIAHCDGCSKMIPSGRPIFKCARCFDYDLCQACYPRISKLHCDGRHPFRKE